MLVAVFIVVSFFLLGGFSLLQYFGVTAAGQQYAGTWGSSDTALGTPAIRITKSGGAYTISGAQALGGRAVAAHVNDDALVATGAVGGVSWRLSLSFANRDQLHAQLTYGDGRPPVETLLTRQ